MWPVILAMARTYAPYVVLPIATVIGVIGKSNREIFIWEMGWEHRLQENGRGAVPLSSGGLRRIIKYQIYFLLFTYFS